MTSFVLVAVVFSAQLGGAVVPSVSHVGEFSDAYSCARAAVDLVLELAAQGDAAPLGPFFFLEAGPPDHPFNAFGTHVGNTRIVLRCLPASVPPVEGP
jgi:hypothetical protein